MNPSPRDNFYRCMTLIVDNGNEAAWELLDYYLSNQGITLKEFIENNQHEIYHLCYNYGWCCRCQYGTVNKPKNRVLYPAQLDNLLDTKGSNIPCTVHVRSKPMCSHTINDHYANPNIATKQLDLTLCRCLLFNFTNILPQGSVERNAFEDVITMRNKCCHAAKGEISSKDYRAYKAQIEKCLLALAQVYGKTHDMQLKIKDAEKRPLDESICKQLQQTILQEQVLQGVSGLHKHIESSKEAEERTTIEIQKMGKRTNRTLMVVKKSIYHTASKVQKQGANTERTLQAVKSSKKSIEHTRAKIQKLEENTEYTAANIEKKLEESSERTILAVESSQKSVDHSSANIEKKLEESSKRTILAVESSQESTATKIQKLDERVSKCETSKRNRLLGLTKTEIEGHLKEGTFVETPAVQACIKLLETNSLLVLTGAAGTGKSRNSLEILQKFQVKNPEFKTVKLTELHDFTDVVTEEEKLVILFEDIFGRTNTRFAENTDVQIIDRLHACTIKGNVKVILTVRDTIRMSCQWILNSHKIFHGKCEVDLSSEKFKMKKTEKESLLLKYFVAHNFQLLEYNDPENYLEEVILDPQITATVNRVTLHKIVESEPLLGFPEACSLFTGNRKLTRLGLSFFKHPSKYLYEEIEKLRKNGKVNEHDRMSYVTLIYILLNEDVLDPDDIELNICFEILESCYGISNKKLPACHITDAANEMIGRYLIFHFNDGTYHLQHQTIFESILISYSKINPGLILSRLSFDFIREMVRLQNYTVREGEIVMKISTKYYSMLANRIIEIILSEYFNKSLSLNFQLLCESEIIRQNDECFMKSLIEKAHDAYFQPDYDLQTFVTYRGVCKLCKLYLPAFLLERITQQNLMNESITLLLHHITSMLNSESEEDIAFVCKSSLLDAFLNVCDLKNNENILDNIWVSVRSLNMSEVTEYIRSSINRVCSRCPMTTMKWMLNNIDRRIFDMNQLLKRACEFKRLDIVQFLCETINHNQFDFTAALVAAINNVWNDADESVSKWLIKNVDLQLFDMKQITSEVLEVGCKKDLKFLLKNVNNCMLDIKLVFNKLYKEGRSSIESLLKWMGTNVDKKKLNTLEMSSLACMFEDIEVVKYLFNNIDLSPLDAKSVLMSSVKSNWKGDNIDLIQWIFLNVDLKQINMMIIIEKAFEERRYDELKILLKNSKENHNTVLRDACKTKQLELIKILLSVVDHDKLNLRDTVKTVCILEKMELLEFFLFNVDHRLYDVHHVLRKSCKYGWTHIVKWLLDNVEHSSLDMDTAMHTALHTEFAGPDKTLVRLLLQYPILDTVDVTEIIKECCWWGILELVRLICEKIDPNQLDMKEAMNTACSRSHFDLVEWMLSNIKNNLFDMPAAFDKAIHADFDDLNASLIQLLIGNTDHKRIDMSTVLKIGCKQCWYDIVDWVLGNADHTVLDVDKAMNSVYDKWMFDEPNIDDNIINYRRKKYEPLIKIILEKVNHSLLNLKKVLNQACHYGSLDVVRLVLENTDHKKIDVKKALDILYISWIYDDTFHDTGINERRDKYEPLIKLMIEKVNYDSLDLKKVLNQACHYGSFDIVKLVLENTDHKRLDVNEAMNIINDERDYCNVYHYYDANSYKRDKYECMMKLILEKVNHDSLGLQNVLNNACRIGSLNVVTLLLENTDHKMLDVQEAMNIICDERDYVDMHYHYHKENSDRRDRNKSLIKLILDKVNHESLDMKIALNLSCHYGLLDFVTFVLENTDHKMLDVKKTTNILYDAWKRNCFNTTIVEIKVIRDQYETLMKLILEKGKHDSLDSQTILNLACCCCSLDVVTLLLEKTDHKMLDVQEAMNIICDNWDSFENYYYDVGKSDGRNNYEQLIKLILDKVNHDSLHLQKVLDCACCYCSLDVVTLLFEKTDHKKLDVKKAMNILCDPRDYYYGGGNSDRKDKHERMIKLILEKVNHDCHDLQNVLDFACRCDLLDVVTLLLEKTDHKKLDVKKAMNIIYDHDHDYNYDEDEDVEEISDRRDKHERMIKLILEKVNHDSLDMQIVLNIACRHGSLDVVTLLLERTDHTMFDVNRAVNCYRFSPGNRNNYKHLIKLFLENVNHSLFDFKKVLNKACNDRSLDTVTWLLMNYNHALFDLNDTMRKACESGESRIITYLVENCDNTLLDITGAMTRVLENNILNDGNEEIIKYLFWKVNKDLIDDKMLQNVPNKLALPFIVTWCLERFDNSTHGVSKAILHRISTEHGYMSMVRSNEGLTLIQKFVTDIDSVILDMKDIMNKACSFGCFDTVTWLLDNEDHSRFDLKMAMSKTFNSSCLCKEELIQLLLQKCMVDEFDMEINMNEACKQGLLKIVKWLIESIDHRLFDLNTAINHLFLDYTDRNQEIFKLLIANISHKLFDIGLVIEQACRLNLTEIVMWLLQAKDHSLFDMKYVMNVACLNSNLRIIKHVYQNMDKDNFNSRSAMNKACRSSKRNSVEVVEWLWEIIQYDIVDMDSAMNNACRYGNIAVVEWLWTNLDRKLFNVESAWDNACYNCNKEILSYLLYNMDENLLDKSKALAHACRNNEEGDKIISLLFKQHNMNTPENCKKVLKDACVHCNRGVVKWLLAYTDIQPLEYKDTLIDTIKATTNKSNNEEKSDHEELVWLMLKYSCFYKITKLHQNDVSDVLEALSSIGGLDMIQWLWNKTEHNKFDMRSIINTACESGQFEIVDWLLQKMAFKNLDVQTVMVESCGYGWLKIVKLLWSKFEIENFDIRTSMNEACLYGRYEIINFLLENVDFKLLDTKTVLEKACLYGWKDIIIWMFDNLHNMSFDLNECILVACSQGRLEIVEIFFSKYGAINFDVDILIDKSCNNCGNAGVIKFLIENFDLKQSHLDIIIKSACKYSWTEIVSSILDKCKHDKNIMEEAMKNACNSGETEIVELFLDKIDISFLGVKINMVISCQKGWDEIVSLLLERVHHSLFDFTCAMNEACRCGEADIVELLIQKVNHENFNFNTAIVEACKSHLNENLVLTLINYINHATSDIEGMSKKACEYGWRKVSSRLKRMSYNEN